MRQQDQQGSIISPSNPQILPFSTPPPDPRFVLCVVFDKNSSTLTICNIHTMYTQGQIMPS